MTGTMPEFSRCFSLDTIGTVPRSVSISATEAECAALAGRFGLVSLANLAATATLIIRGDAISAQGRFTADVVQSCTASGDDVPAQFDEAFSIRFIAILADGDATDEIELLADDCDTVDHDGQSVDLGEAIAQTLGLSLDPFPRSPVAAKVLKEAGVLSEEEVETGPFAGLKGLLGKS